MGKGSSTPSNTTQTTRSEPWGPVQPHLQNIMSEAQRLYSSGAGQDFFPGSTVVPFSPQTEAGLTALEGQAAGGTPLQGQAYDAAGRILSGFNPAMAPTMQAAMSGNFWDPTRGQIDAASMIPTTAGIPQLYNTAGGGNLFSPLLASQFNQGADLIRNQVGGVFNNSGMYGSAAHQKELTSGLGNLWTNLAAPAYQFERGQQDAAAQALGGFQQQDLARLLQGAGMGADYQLGGAQLAGDFWNRGNVNSIAAMGSLPGIYSYGQMPAEQLLQAGQAREEMAGLNLNDVMSRFQQEQMAPWAALDQYRAAIGEMPLQGLGTTSGQQQSQRASNPLMSGMGGALGGAQMGSSFGPWGTLIGAGLGGLLGYMGG